jgi:hypothetical protein
MYTILMEASNLYLPDVFKEQGEWGIHGDKNS